MSRRSVAAPGNQERRVSSSGSVAAATPIRPLHVLILGGLSAIGPLSTDMYLPALPLLSRELGASMSQTQLTYKTRRKPPHLSVSG